MPRPTPTYRKIEGQHHPLAKRIRRLVRSGELYEARSGGIPESDTGELAARGLVLLETQRIIEDALASGVAISSLLLRSSSKARFAALVEKLPAGTSLYEVTPAVFETLVTTETSPGVLALAEPPSWREDDLFPAHSPALIPVLAGIQDPGNLGTILRASEAFGATGVLLARGTVSPYNAKALRATAGAIFRLPILRDLPTAEILALLRKNRVRIFTTDVSGGLPPARASLVGPLALVLGSEGAGLPPEFQGVGESLTIPLAGRAESLNVASAASVILYEIARQRSLSEPRAVSDRGSLFPPRK